MREREGGREGGRERERERGREREERERERERVREIERGRERYIERWGERERERERDNKRKSTDIEKILKKERESFKKNRETARTMNIWNQRIDKEIQLEIVRNKERCEEIEEQQRNV